MCLRQKKHILKNSLSKQDFRSKGGNEAECSLVTTNGLLLELKCPVILGWTWPGSSILYLSFFCCPYTHNYNCLFIACCYCPLSLTGELFDCLLFVDSVWEVYNLSTDLIDGIVTSKTSKGIPFLVTLWCQELLAVSFHELRSCWKNPATSS